MIGVLTVSGDCCGRLADNPAKQTKIEVQLAAPGAGK